MTAVDIAEVTILGTDEEWEQEKACEFLLAPCDEPAAFIVIRQGCEHRIRVFCDPHTRRLFGLSRMFCTQCLRAGRGRVYLSIVRALPV